MNARHTQANSPPGFSQNKSGPIKELTILKTTVSGSKDALEDEEEKQGLPEAHNQHQLKMHVYLFTLTTKNPCMPLLSPDIFKIQHGQFYTDLKGSTKADLSSNQ